MVNRQTPVIETEFINLQSDYGVKHSLWID